MNKSASLKIVLEAFDNTKRAFDSVQKNISRLEPTFRKMRNWGTVAFGALSAGIGMLVKSSLEVDRVSNTFDKLTKSIGSSSKIIDELRKATYGLVDDTELMKQANKLMAMSLAGNEKELKKLMNIAVRLGSAMGTGPTEAMENFALMLANQSIPRLDTFGISSGRVRKRIEELMKANKEMTRDQAFMIATMEEAEKTLKKLGDYVPTAGERLKQLGVKFENLKSNIGNAFIPVLEKLVSAIEPAVNWFVKFSEKHPKIVANVGLAITAIAGLVAVIGGLGMALGPIIAGLSVLSGTFGIVVGAGAALAGLFAYLWKNSEVFRFMVELLWNSLKELGDMIMGAIRDALEFFGAKVNSNSDVLRILGKVLKWIAEAVGVVFVATIYGWIEIFKGWFKLLGFTFNLLKEFGSYLADTFIGAFKTLSHWVEIGTNAFKAMSDFLGGVFYGVVDKVKGAVESLINSLVSAWNWMKKVYKNSVGAIGGVVSSVGSYLGFASGGVVPGPVGSPQLILAHGGEEIVPYHKRGGSGVVVNINGGVYLDERVAEEIGNKIIEKLGGNAII